MQLTQGTFMIVLPKRYIESLKIDLCAKSCFVYQVTPSNNLFFFVIKKRNYRIHILLLLSINNGQHNS